MTHRTPDPPRAGSCTFLRMAWHPEQSAGSTPSLHAAASHRLRAQQLPLAEDWFRGTQARSWPRLSGLPWAMSAKGHAQATNKYDRALARETSLFLDEDIVTLFPGSRDASGLPTSFLGTFGTGKGVNQYGSRLREDDEQQLEKWTSLNHIVPVGMELEGDSTQVQQRHPGTAALPIHHRRPPHLAAGMQQQPQLTPRQAHQQQKQGSQQRGPGRPAAWLDGRGSSSSPGAKRCAPEPQAEPSAKPAAAAAPRGPASAEGGAQAPAAKKPLKFKVKFNGRVVGTAGAGPGPSMADRSPSPLPEAGRIVDAMCGLGSTLLLSPLPSHWARIVAGESPSPGSAAAVPTAATCSPSMGAAQGASRALSPNEQHGQPGHGPSHEAAPSKGEPGSDNVVFAARSLHLPDSPFAKAAASPGRTGSPQPASPLPAQREQPGASPAAAAVPDAQPPWQPRGSSSPPQQPDAVGFQSVLIPVPSLWGRIMSGDSSAPPAAATPAAAKPAQQVEQPAARCSNAVPAAGAAAVAQRREQQQHPSAGAAAPRKRGLEGAASGSGRQQQQAQQGGRVGEAGAAAPAGPPAAKRPRSASAEPSGSKEQDGLASRRMGSCELPAAGEEAAPAAPPTQPQPRIAMPDLSMPVPHPGATASIGSAWISSPGKRPPAGPSVPRREVTPHRIAAAPQPAAASPSGHDDRGRAPQQQQQPGLRPSSAHASPGSGDATPLGAVAAPLLAMLQSAADQAPPANNIMQLQEEGRRLKRFAERKMAGERHTHVSCTFLLSSGLKFLAAAGIMDGMTQKYSRDSACTMYSQTAAMLESCAHASARAEGPALGTQVVALLAERLGAVARLRAAHCVRNELNRDAAAFRSAVETARGETFQRPSPTDSNVSATVSIPLEGGSPVGAAASKRRQQQPGSGGGGGSASASPAGRSKKPGGRGAEEGAGGSAAVASQLLGIPRAIADREMAMAGHMQGVMAALSAFGRSSERLRDYMGKAALEGNMHAMRAASGTLLLCADAGMGRMEWVVNVGREALDAAMKIES